MSSIYLWAVLALGGGTILIGGITLSPGGGFRRRRRAIKARLRPEADPREPGAEPYVSTYVKWVDERE